MILSHPQEEVDLALTHYFENLLYDWLLFIYKTVYLYVVFSYTLDYHTSIILLWNL